MARRHGVAPNQLFTETDSGACASDSEKIPPMHAVISLESGDHVDVDALPMNLRREIWEGFAQALVQGDEAGLVASATGWAYDRRNRPQRVR